MHHYSKLLAASTLAVFGLAARAEDAAQTAPAQAPSATAEPAPVPAQAGAPAAAPGKNPLYYDPSDRPEPNRPGASSTPQFTPGQRRHVGWYLRFDGGAGYQSQSWTEGGVDYKFAGPALNLGGTMGGAIAPNVILAGRVFFGSAPNPKLTQGNQSSDTTGVTTNIVEFGPEIVYYLMPANVFLAASVAVTRQTQDLPGNRTGVTEIGLGAQAMLGKEWWVSDRIALGLAAQATYSSNSNSTFTVRGLNAGLVCTFTMG